VAESVFSFKKDPYYAKRFPAARLPLTFRLIDSPFTEKNRMINSTLKIVRHRIKEAYKDEIEYLYTDAGRDPLNEANLGAIKKLLHINGPCE
jgi:long-chain acyl-CoA synthetase